VNSIVAQTSQGALFLIADQLPVPEAAKPIHFLYGTEIGAK